MLPCCYSMRNFESRATSHGLGSLPRPIQVATALRHPATSAIQPAPTSLRSSPTQLNLRPPALRVPRLSASPTPPFQAKSFSVPTYPFSPFATPALFQPHPLLPPNTRYLHSPRFPRCSPLPFPRHPSTRLIRPFSFRHFYCTSFHPLPLPLHLLQGVSLLILKNLSSWW
ncbi:unnamed protein product [Closterium sp. NIES-53]